MEAKAIVASLRDRPHDWVLEGTLLCNWQKGFCLWSDGLWWKIERKDRRRIPLLERWRIHRAYRRWRAWEKIHRLGRSKEVVREQ